MKPQVITCTSSFGTVQDAGSYRIYKELVDEVEFINERMNVTSYPTSDSILDLYSPSFLGHPHRAYAEIRSRNPVSRVRLPDGTLARLVTRYADVRALLRDQSVTTDSRRQTRAASAALTAIPPHLHRYFFRGIRDIDRPDHTRLRTLIAPAFSTHRVKQLAPRIAQIAHGLLDRIAPGGRVDLVESYSYPLPLTVVCEILGIPPQWHDSIRQWTVTLTFALPHETGRVADAAADMVGLVRQVIEEHQVHPRTAVIADLVCAHLQGRLDEDELISMTTLLLIVRASDDGQPDRELRPRSSGKSQRADGAADRS